MNKLPLARNNNLVIQNAGREILFYDLTTNKAYCLNETLATVYQACDGKTSFDELKAKTKFTDDIIYLSLDELKKQDFIKQSEYISPFTGMSRREVIRKVGLASMIALPVMTSLIAPTSASAASGKLPLLAVCTTDAECDSSFCNPISFGASGDFCCARTVSIAFPGKNLCVFNQSDCNRRCCSGSGVNDPTFSPMCASPSNPFPCLCT